MERICQNCKHFRSVICRDSEEGTIAHMRYCHAQRSYPYKNPEDTCLRWRASAEAIARESFITPAI